MTAQELAQFLTSHLPTGWEAWMDNYTGNIRVYHNRVAVWDIVYNDDTYDIQSLGVTYTNPTEYARVLLLIHTNCNWYWTQ